MDRRTGVLGCLVSVAVVNAVAAGEPAEVAPDPDRGIYAIWATERQRDGLDFLVGGQIVLQWADLQVGPARYDFSALDRRLADLNAADAKATVQVNGNKKPEFLFGVVPSKPERLGKQGRDRRGTLMYWHPTHEDAYLRFIHAFGEHVRQSPHRGSILGVRLNFNAIGTEHLNVPREHRDPAGWDRPKGVRPGEPWTPAVMARYKTRVVHRFVQAFRPHTRVFVRNAIVLDKPMDRTIARWLDEGEVGIFHTSSEVQPRGESTEERYRGFLRYARTGKTVAYAESWADAWGRHGGTVDERWCSPCQWNYWRTLVDLHCGVSFIAVYGEDLRAAKTDPEFRAALEFAAKYAGCHASPSDSPGAWVAFREGDFLRGDYTFLMERLTDAGEPVELAGPANQRFGAWARRFSPGTPIRVSINPRLLDTSVGDSLALRVTYLDDRRGGWFRFRVGGFDGQCALTGTGRWKTEAWLVPGSAFLEGLSIEPMESPLTLHMVEVSR